MMTLICLASITTVGSTVNDAESDNFRPLLCIKGDNKTSNEYIRVRPNSNLEIVIWTVSSECTVTLHLIEEYLNGTQLCPLMCLQPQLSLNRILLTPKLGALFDPEELITCTLTLEMLQSELSIVDDKAIYFYSALEIIFWRVLLECQESLHLSYQHHLPRRKLDGLIVWIGSEHRRHLIEQQFAVLSRQPSIGPNAVLGWAATDLIYSCSTNSTSCTYRRGTSQGKAPRKFLPQSAINYMPEGWRCAQRRPLRALAHVLALIDPNFIVLLDDDTFLNYELLVLRFGGLLRGDMLRQSQVLGEFSGAEGPGGHLTTKGMFVGGSGYVLGRQTCLDLIAHKLQYFEDKTAASKSQSRLKPFDLYDEYRSVQQVQHLSLYNEAHDKAMTTGEHCASHACVSKPTVKPPETGQPIHQQVATTVRLIDLCVSLMAHDNTCHHSDHSMGRCLFYGAYATPVSVICHSLVDNPPADLLLGLCFMTKQCDPSKHITCHRHRPHVATDGSISAVKISKDKFHFKVFSSMFDGNKTDTYG